MTASEIFGIVIRCTGLALTLLGINDIYRVLIMILQTISATSFVPLLFGIPALLLGIWCLRGAPSLVSFSYPENCMKEK